jgi:hypothetical protein
MQLQKKRSQRGYFPSERLVTEGGSICPFYRISEGKSYKSRVASIIEEAISTGKTGIQQHFNQYMVAYSPITTRKSMNNPLGRRQECADFRVI